MKRQELEKMIGKKIEGAMGKAPRSGASAGKAGKGARGAEGNQPMAVRLIKGLGQK